MVESPTASFMQQSQELRARIDAGLDAYTQLTADCPTRLRDAMRHSLLAPGKRLRPLLVLMAARACGETDETALPAACAVEMVHAYSLIHDDLPAMDDDDLRRGRPTCHRAFDEATAILAGDALLTLAFEVLASGIEPPNVAARCCAELARAAGAEGMVGGQADDLHHEHATGPLDLLQHIHRRKTGALFLTALRLGGLVARADADKLGALDAYGRKLGLAFQVVDDLLDAAGNQELVGKRVGKDQQRGKMTFPGLLGVEQSTLRARELIDEACQALSGFDGQATSLQALARYVLERKQ